MRVSVYAESPVSFQKGRYGGEALVRSFSALRNYVQQTDRATEMPIVLKQGNTIGSTGNSDDMGGRTGSLMNARLSNQNFISDALDLIEEDQGNNTSMANDDGNESSDEETREKRKAPSQ